MRITKIITSLVILPLLFSCKEDLMKNIEKGDWNNERSIIDITFEHQVGLATITRDKENNGMITFMLNEETADKSKIKIKEIELSYGATADVGLGDELNFDNPENCAYITVTSPSGLQRSWKITCQPFSEELLGTWYIITLSVYGGAYPEYGATEYYENIVTRNWNWEQDGTGPIAEYDNTLTFTLEGITENGDTYGTLVNDAGPDGKYANFIFIDDPDNERIPIDVNYHYRKIPVGESKWKRNSRQGTITFTASDSTSTTGRFIDNVSEELDSDGNSMTVIDHAFKFEYDLNYGWGDIYKDREKFVDNLRYFWIQVIKTD